MAAQIIFEPEIFGGFHKGHRFGLWIGPAKGSVRGTILCIQTPGEENNQCRRLTVKAASRFAAMGFVVLIFEPYGVGDSCGETVDARLRDWRQDLMTVSMKLRLKHDAPFYIWGARLGTLLAADLMISQSDNTAGVLLWAPLAHGQTWLGQQAPGQTLSRLLKSLTPKTSLDVTVTRNGSIRTRPQAFATSLGQQFASEPGSVVIAGTQYSRAFLQELQALSLNPVKLQAGYGKAPAAHFLGISNGPRRPDGQIPCPPSLQAMADTWQGAGYRVKAEGVAGSHFWASQGISEPLTLFEAGERWLEATLVEA